MSLLKMLKVAHEETVRDPAHVLVARFDQLMKVEGARHALKSMLPDLALKDQWQIRDYAVAVHRLEQVFGGRRVPLESVNAETLDEDFRAELAEIQENLAHDEEVLLNQIDRVSTVLNAAAASGVAAAEARGRAPEYARPEWFWEIAIAINAAFKGLLGSMNESGHICAKTIPVEGQLDVGSGWPELCKQVCAKIAGEIENGDVVVIADKVVAAAEGRIVPRHVILEPDPKTIPAAELETYAAKYSQAFGINISPLHLLLGDEYSGNRATLGAEDHNRACLELAREIRAAIGVDVDVVISDTDTGLDTRRPLIGTLTIGATPVGATAGLTLYEAMRCAVAAEFVRGHNRVVPVVICIPAERRRRREKIGAYRGYAGALDFNRETALTHA